MHDAERALELFSHSPKFTRTPRGRTCSAEVVSDRFWCQQFIDRFQSTLIPYLFKPTANNSGILVLQHGCIVLPDKAIAQVLFHVEF